MVFVFRVDEHESVINHLRKSSTNNIDTKKMPLFHVTDHADISHQIYVKNKYFKKNFCSFLFQFLVLDLQEKRRSKNLEAWWRRPFSSYCSHLDAASLISSSKFNLNRLMSKMDATSAAEHLQNVSVAITVPRFF